MVKKHLLLFQFQNSPFSKLWISLKVFIKEGLIYQQWQNVFKNKLLGGSIEIPQALAKGLQSIQAPVVINEVKIDNYQVISAFKTVPALMWALKMKKKGFTKKVLAGPFISSLPADNQAVLMNSQIDGLIFLCEWHRKLFMSYYPRQEVRQYIWFSGVDTEFWRPTQIDKKNILIYIKTEDSVTTSVLDFFKSGNFSYQTIHYGFYDKNEYKDRLNQAQLVIFLSGSETQGLAIFEAWSMGVPTLHWDREYMEYFGKKYEGASSCPYLSSQCGEKFKTFADFENTLMRMLGSLEKYQPRQYILDNYTLKHSAQRYVEILEDLAGS